MHRHHNWGLSLPQNCSVSPYKQPLLYSPSYEQIPLPMDSVLVYNVQWNLSVTNTLGPAYFGVANFTVTQRMSPFTDKIVLCMIL